MGYKAAALFRKKHRVTSPFDVNCQVGFIYSLLLFIFHGPKNVVCIEKRGLMVCHVVDERVFVILP